MTIIKPFCAKRVSEVRPEDLKRFVHRSYLDRPAPGECDSDWLFDDTLYADNIPVPTEHDDELRLAPYTSNRTKLRELVNMVRMRSTDPIRQRRIHDLRATLFIDHDDVDYGGNDIYREVKTTPIRIRPHYQFLRHDYPSHIRYRVDVEHVYHAFFSTSCDSQVLHWQHPDSGLWSTYHIQFVPYIIRDIIWQMNCIYNPNLKAFSKGDLR